MISERTAAEILRLAEVEKWPVGTIASQIGVHHSVVTRVLREKSIVRGGLCIRPCRLDPYKPFVVETLEKYPRLPASRLYQMVCERGYKGGQDHFRAMIAKLRPKPAAEAFMRLRTLPGEQAQVDWADFGKHEVEGTLRRLCVFVMTLSYSRRMFVRYSYSAAMGAFIRGHVQAFEHFGGVPRTVLYDNLRSAVTNRVADAIQFNETCLEFASHYRYLPKPVAVARGNEKGRVERSIQYIRTSFFPARQFGDIADLNCQAAQWVSQIADQRPCPGDPRRRVIEVFEDERAQLLSPPDSPFPDEDRVVVKVGKTPYVRFDLNDYSVPHTHTRQSLTVLATEHTVRILDDTKVIATHTRSWGKGKQIEDVAHIQELADRKSHGHRERSLDRLHHACPSCQQLFRIAADQGCNLNALTVGLTRMLDSTRADVLETAIVEATRNRSPHMRAIRHYVDMQQQQSNQPPPVELHFTDRTRALSIPVHPHALSSYDQLYNEVQDNDE